MSKLRKFTTENTEGTEIIGTVPIVLRIRLDTTYVHGNNIDEVLQMRDETPTLYYYVTNVQGNVVAIADSRRGTAAARQR